MLPWPRAVSCAADGEPLRLGAGLQLASAPGVSARLQRMLERQQQRLDALLGAAGNPAPRLRVRVEDDTDALPVLDVDESWQLRLDADGGVLTAATPFGAAHGLERLLQCVEHGREGPLLRPLVIDDAPRLPWRGLLLDIARHPLPLPTLLRTLDGMAVLGLNVLHLHLNDDQGFRVEVPSRPELHVRGGVHGHLGTHEVERLVAEAADRGIRVVPELDVPGHAGAILWAHPELAAGPPPRALPRTFGPSRHALDPSLDATWACLDAVVGDLAALFPDPFLHLGGDEVHPEVYAFEDPRRQAWMRAEGIEDAAGVQAWFVRRMTALLARHDRRALGWDEVLQPGAPAELVIQSWRGAATLTTALRAGHDALFSSGWYLDLCYPSALHYGFDPAAGPRALARAEAALLAAPSLDGVRGGAESLLAAAAAVKVPAAVTPGRLLGGEACLWSELVTAELLDVRLYGRLPAVAERLWSPAEVNDPAEFHRRLPALLGHLEASTDCRPLDGSTPLLLRLGVEPEELADVAVLMAALEPVRWYRRLLGPRLLARRVGAAAGEGSGMGSGEVERPYDADRLLLRVVDLLAPESLDLLALRRQLAAWRADPADAQTAFALRERARRWRVAGTALADLCRRSPEFAEVRAQLDALGELGDLLAERVDGASSADEVDRLDALQAGLDAGAEVRLAALDVLRETARAW